MLDVRIRLATPSDAPRLHELHTASVRQLCAPHYAPEIIDGWLANRRPAGYLPPIERGDLFVAEHSASIVGFGEAVPGLIVACYVEPTIVRRGVGSGAPVSGWRRRPKRFTISATERAVTRNRGSTPWP